MKVNDLTPLLKRLKLGQMLPTLPERISLARRDRLDYVPFLEIILADEVNRRDRKRLQTRLQTAGFEQVCRMEDFDWDSDVSMDRRLVDAAFSLEFLDRAEHVLLVGPVGVGKSFLAQALGVAVSKVRLPGALCQGRPLLPRHGPGQAGRECGEDLQVLSVPGPADPLTIWDCRGLPSSSRTISTSWSSPSIVPRALPSPPTGQSRNGSRCLPIRCWATAPWTGWPTPATRSSSTGAATARSSPRIGPCWLNSAPAMVDGADLKTF